MISDFDSASALPSSPTPLERVLVIPRSVFEEQGAFQGFRSLVECDDLGVYLQCAPFKRALFMDKPLAELDARFKQILPYMVIMTGESVLTYRRGKLGDEGRLHGLLSVGVGGHINEEDGHEPYEAFIKGALRELKEEIGMVGTEQVLSKTVVGLVNDDSNSVGEVHLGVIHVIQVGEDQAARIIINCEKTMVEPSWVPLRDFRDPLMVEAMESWSQIVMTYLLAEYEEGGKWTDPAWRERLLLAASCASNMASCCNGLMLQESPRSHELCVSQLEVAIGQLQCVISGLTSNEDIEEESVKQAAHGFHAQLGNILRHQQIQENE